MNFFLAFFENPVKMSGKSNLFTKMISGKQTATQQLVSRCPGKNLRRDCFYNIFANFIEFKPVSTIKFIPIEKEDC